MNSASVAVHIAGNNWDSVSRSCVWNDLRLVLRSTANHH